MLGEYVC